MFYLQKKGIHVDLETDDTIAHSKNMSGKFPGGPVARTNTFTAEHQNSIPSQETKNPQTLQCSQRKNLPIVSKYCCLKNQCD